MPNSKHQFTLHQAPIGASIHSGSSQDLEQSVHARKLESAFQRGVQQGTETAMEEGAKLLHAAADRLDAARELALGQLTHSAVELGVEIARQILCVEIDADHYDLERVVRNSLAHAGMGRGEARVHVSQRDYERLRTVNFRAGTQVIPDSKLDEGDVHIDAEQGLLVREIDSSLEAIREQLLEDLI